MFPKCCQKCYYHGSDCNEISGETQYYCVLNIKFPTIKQTCKKQNYGIYYKVVRRKSRASFILGADVENYSLKYNKNTVVEAPKGTLGIFVFKNKKSAIEFKNNFDFIDARVIPVLGIGKFKAIEKISKISISHYYGRGGLYFQLHRFYFNKYKIDYTDKLPIDTVVFDKVKVLD